MRVALYSRCSTVDRGQNPEVQLRELREYAHHRGWEIIEEFVDATSGVKEKRPQLDQLLQDMRRGKFHGVVIVRLDRLGRSLKNLISLLSEFQERNIVLVSLKECIDFSTSMGKLMFHIIGGLAEFERDLIRERVKSGLAFARSKGVRIGRAPLSIDPQNIHRLKNQGLSLRKIAKEVGVSPSYVWKILHAHTPDT